MPSAALDPFFANTPNDHGARPVVMGYIGAGITIAVTAIRLGLTVNRSHTFSPDDWCFATAALLSVAASVTLERAVDAGLGKHADVLSHGQLQEFTKFAYATELIGILAQIAAKFSVACLYMRLVPRQERKAINVVFAILGVWSVFAIFATAFECGGSVSWSNECSTGGYLFFPVAATNLITDGLLGCWMLPRIRKLQASLRDRLLPCLLMGSRLLVCVLQLGMIIYVGQRLNDGILRGDDRTWTATTSFIIAIAVVHLSVITATIPRINSFIADMQTRRAGLALTQRDYESYKHSKSGSKNDSKNRSGNRSGNRSQNRSGKYNLESRSKSPDAGGVLNSFRPEQIPGLSRGSKGSPEEIELDNRDAVETSSQSSLRGNAVYWKTEFRWEEEYSAEGSQSSGRPQGMQRY